MNIARISKLSALLCTIATVLITSSTFAATAAKARQLSPGEKAKVSGVILSREGNLVRVRDKKSHEEITVSIGDATRIERKKHTFEFSFFSAAGEARIIATSIPLAILTSLIALSLIGQTINIMTLGGFALAVGILVDDATAEVENINRNRAAEPDKDMDELVLDSAMQIATPAFVSTLSICKFGCRTVAASGVLMNNNQYENHRRFDLRVREGLNHG